MGDGQGLALRGEGESPAYSRGVTALGMCPFFPLWVKKDRGKQEIPLPRVLTGQNWVGHEDTRQTPSGFRWQTRTHGEVACPGLHNQASPRSQK